MASTTAILLLLCACTFALPTDRFARGVLYCEPQTPCAWAIYAPYTQEISTHVTNTYCKCAEGKVCTIDTDDQMSKTFVYSCKTPQNTS